MLNHSQPRTFSQALLNLGRIRSVEDSIVFGLWGLYKAKRYKSLDESERQEVKRHLTDLKNFCQTFELIVEEDKSGSNELKQIARANLGIETTKSLSSIAGIYSLISNKERRERESDDVKFIQETLQHVLDGKVVLNEIDGSLEKLGRLRKTLHRDIETEKRESERIISGRPLIK